MTKLQTAIKAIKAGDRRTGEQLLRQLLETEPDNEASWLWLASAVEARGEKIRCLAQVLNINPDNNIAQRGIARLNAKSPETHSTPPVVSRQLKRLKKVEAEGAKEATWLTWDEVWFSAVSRPSVSTFEYILTGSQISIGRAFLWLGISSAVAAALGFLLTLIVERLTTGQVSQSTIIALAAGVTVGPVVGIFSAAIVAGLIQWVARLLGGQGTFGRLIYVQAAYAAPLGIVIAALMPIPGLNLLSIILYIYAFILNVLATQAVNRFSTGRAIAAVFIPGIALGSLVACGILLFVIALAGAMAGQ